MSKGGNMWAGAQGGCECMVKCGPKGCPVDGIHGPHDAGGRTSSVGTGRRHGLGENLRHFGSHSLCPKFQLRSIFSLCHPEDHSLYRGGRLGGPSWCVGEVMVDPFMRIKGNLEVPLATRRYLWGHGGGAFRRESVAKKSLRW